MSKASKTKTRIPRTPEFKKQAIAVATWVSHYKKTLGIIQADAHFIPLFDKEFIADLNNDSYPEIAVAVWHGGNAVRYCRAILFSVKEDKLVPLATHEINYEFSRSVFKNRGEANLKNESLKGIQDLIQID